MNKPSIFSFLTTLLLVAVICTQGREIVKDSAGHSVEFGRHQYFIQPVKTASNNGGGLVPAAIAVNPLCPLGITQTSLPVQPGLPVSFLPVLLTAPDKFVRIGIPYMIEFKSDIWPVCKNFSKLWAVNSTELSPVSKEIPIIIGGKVRAFNARFFVEKAEGANTYKLTTNYGTIGTIPGFFWRELVATNDNAKTLLVEFKKVDDVTTATTSTSVVEKLGLRMFPFY